MRGVDALLRNFSSSFFHADPHPAIISSFQATSCASKILEMVGYLSQDQRKELLSCFIAFTERERIPI